MNPLNGAPAGRGLRRFVLGLLLGVAGSIGIAAWAQPHGAGMMGGPGMMMGHRFDRALADVGASDAQRTQVKQIMQAAMADLRQQHEATRACASSRCSSSASRRWMPTPPRRCASRCSRSTTRRAAHAAGDARREPRADARAARQARRAHAAAARDDAAPRQGAPAAANRTRPRRRCSKPRQARQPTLAGAFAGSPAGPFASMLAARSSHVTHDTAPAADRRRRPAHRDGRRLPRRAGYAVDSAGSLAAGRERHRGRELRRPGARPDAARRRRPRAVPRGARQPAHARPAAADADRARRAAGPHRRPRARRRRLPAQAVRAARAAGAREGAAAPRAPQPAATTCCASAASRSTSARAWRASTASPAT